MELKDLVVSQPLAQRMKELGWEQENACFWWRRIPSGYTTLELGKFVVAGNFFTFFAAPTFAEIWEKLPINRTLRTDDEGHFCYLACENEQEVTLHSTIAEAAGELWCWWKEKNGYRKRKGKGA